MREGEGVFTQSFIHGLNYLPKLLSIYIQGYTSGMAK